MKGAETMKKTYRLEELDCAHCAAKIERAVAKLDGVTSASVNFMSGRMTVELPEASPAVLEEIARTVRKVEPDVELVSC